ncbi:hypothetical protein SH661x_000042 [Planctomicrobium sp. SH661]|uniref:hypothetical protein n=1 Tax=Planctomicrobium sp. SH661 TaxID=3448124 RepID=UPI003F5B0A64
MKNGGPAKSSVTGTVMISSQPVTEGSVLFVADDGTTASAQIQADGKYVLSCPMNKYQVSVAPLPPPDPRSKGADASIGKSAVIKIPQKYRDVGTSNLLVDVNARATQFDINMDAGK